MTVPRLKKFPPPKKGPQDNKKKSSGPTPQQVEDKRKVEALREAIQKKLQDPKEAKKAAQWLSDLLETTDQKSKKE